MGDGSDELRGRVRELEAQVRLLTSEASASGNPGPASSSYLSSSHHEEGEEEEEEHHNETWAELFFDLVFLLVIAQLGHRFAHESESGSVMTALSQLLILFSSVYGVWIYAVVYVDNRGVSTSTFDHVMVFFQMLSMITIAASIKSVLVSPDATVIFLIALAGQCLVLGLGYVHMYYKGPARYQRYARNRVVTLFVLFGIQIVSTLMAYNLVDTVAIQVLMVFSLVWGNAAPSYLPGLSPNEAIPYVPGHIHGRLGLFTIIVLGEGITPVVNKWSTVFAGPAIEQGVEGIVAGLLSFVVAFSMYLTYFAVFNTIDTEIWENENRLRTQNKRCLPWQPAHVSLLGNILLFCSMLACSVGMEKILEDFLKAAEGDLELEIIRYHQTIVSAASGTTILCGAVILVACQDLIKQRLTRAGCEDLDRVRKAWLGMVAASVSVGVFVLLLPVFGCSHIVFLILLGGFYLTLSVVLTALASVCKIDEHHGKLLRVPKAITGDFSITDQRAAAPTQNTCNVVASVNTS